MVNELMSPLKPLATPAYMLELGSQDITANIAPRLISLQVTDNRGLAADDLTLVLDDSDQQIQMPSRGATIRVSIGYQGEPLVGVGDFKIDQIKHEGAPDKVTVIGRSADFSQGLNVEREFSWHDTTLGAIVEAIAARNGLKASIAGSLTNIKIAHIDQTMESDASFLHRLAVRNGAALSIKRNTLMLVKPGQCKSPDGKDFSMVTITRGDGDKHVFELANRISYTGVIARWLETKEPKKTQQVHLQRKTAPPATTATTHPKSQPGTEKKSKAPEALMGEEGNVYVMSTVFASQDEANKAAEALWNHIQSNAAKFSITLALGRADIVPEAPVQVSGFKDVINNTTWVISKVTHMMSNTGFITKLDLEIKIEEGQYDAIQN